MRTPAEAIALILGRAPGPTVIEEVPLERAAGRCLAAEIRSDVDLPPFEKSAMDGFALRADELASLPATLDVVGESRAGAPYTGNVARGACVGIYTGAELPADCDTVVMVEHVHVEGERARFESPVKRGQNVNHRGEVMSAGAVALRPPRRISAADLAVLAAAGVDPVRVHARPRVSILTTGDELVPVGARPGRCQIREGNTLYLRAAAERAGASVRRVGIVPDELEELVARFGEALELDDALITTGGVSMGKYDLVGEALERLGVEPVLHKVAVKPGKPIWFGVRGQKPVFGLPGNPVSSMLGFELFVRPALAKMGGAPESEQRERLRLGRWTGGPVKPDERQNNLPARVEQGDDGVDRLVPLAYKGSADIVALTEATALAVVPPGQAAAPGQMLQYRPL